MPVVSVTGTNGKSTVTRLITHILLRAGRHVGTTTSDGILVDERLVDAGDWTGPGGAAAILRRATSTSPSSRPRAAASSCAAWATSPTSASVFTNVSSDHLDLGGIHTLPELAEVKATVCRVTRPGRLGRAQRRRPAGRRGGAPGPRAGRLLLAGPGRLAARSPATAARAGGRTSLSRGRLVERDGARRRTRSSTSRTCRSRSAGSPATTSRTRWRRPAGPGRWARRSSRSRTACATSGRRPTCRRAGSTCSGSAGGRHRGLRAQRGGHRGDPRVAAGDRRRRGRPTQRRSPRSSAPRATGRTTRCAASGGSRPDGPSGSRSRRRWPTCGAATGGGRPGPPRGHRRGGMDPAAVPVYETRARRPSRRSWPAPGPPRGDAARRCPAGGRAVLPRGARRGVRAAGAPRGEAARRARGAARSRAEDHRPPRSLSPGRPGRSARPGPGRETLPGAS